MIRPPEERAILRQAAEIRRKHNRERKASRPKHERSEGQRQPRERDNGYLQFLRRLPCCIGFGCEGRTEAAHIRYGNPAVGRLNPGMQTKSDDRWATPLCSAHHRSQHGANERAWWQAWNIDPDALATNLHTAYRTGEANPVDIILKHRREANRNG